MKMPGIKKGQLPLSFFQLHLFKCVFDFRNRGG